MSPCSSVPLRVSVVKKTEAESSQRITVICLVGTAAVKAPPHLGRPARSFLRLFIMDTTATETQVLQPFHQLACTTDVFAIAVRQFFPRLLCLRRKLQQVGLP